MCCDAWLLRRRLRLHLLLTPSDRCGPVIVAGPLSDTQRARARHALPCTRAR